MPVNCQEYRGSGSARDFVAAPEDSYYVGCAECSEQKKHGHLPGIPHPLYQ
jgi:hypothetical protein